MNILYHHRTQGHGAEGVHIKSIVQGFERHGHRVILLGPPGTDAKKTAGQYLYAATPSLLSRFWKAVSKSCPQIFFEFIEIGYNFYHALRLRKILRDEKIDFVYERYAFFLFITGVICRSRKIPLIVEVNEIAGIPRARPLILRKISQTIEKYIFSLAGSVVTVSSFLKAKIAEAGTPADKVIVMPNGVDSEMFHPCAVQPGTREKLGLGSSVVIGFVGWIDPWDNLPGLLEIFSELLHKKFDVKLLLIGDIAGKGVDKNLISKMVSDLNLSASVVHVRGVPRAEMPQHIGAIDICVIPDSNMFGSPVVLFEFMGMGKAVVAPSVPPVMDVLTNEDNGLIFVARDRDSMSQMLTKAVEDKNLREKISKNARASIEAKHTWNKNADAVLALQERIAKTMERI